MPLQKFTVLCYSDNPLFNSALKNGGIDNHIKNIRTSFAILKVSIQNQQDMNFLSKLEVLTHPTERPPSAQMETEKQDITVLKSL